MLNSLTHFKYRSYVKIIIHNCMEVNLHFATPLHF